VDVKLLAYTPEPIRVLWTAARTCYSADMPQELWEDYPYVLGCQHEECGPNKVIKLLRSLWERGHHSVFEHVSFTYAVSGVSRVLLAQYSRHRIGVSLSVQSQRHMVVGGALEALPVVFPKRISPDIFEVYSRTVETAFEGYRDLINAGVPAEDARFLLPQAVVTNFVTTVNLRSLMYLYRVRVLEPGAQWEIRALVQRMVELAGEAVPELGLVIPEVRREVRQDAGA